MTNIGPAVTIRSGLEQVLTGAENLDELMMDVRQFGAEWFGWDAPEDTYTYEELNLPAFEEYPLLEIEGLDASIIVTPTYDEYPETYEQDESHPAADYEASNPSVPEPTVTPGLTG